MQRATTKYTAVGDAQIAYQVIGEGPLDLVVVSGLLSNIEAQWDYAPMARRLERLASFSRLITFDRRGTGISDPVRFETLPTWEHWTEDLTAVLDAADSQRAAILASVDGGPWAVLFAATYPERTSALVLWNSYAKITRTHGYPIGRTVEENNELIAFLASVWGTEELARLASPGRADDDASMRALARYQRLSSTPANVAAAAHYLDAVDTRSVLPSVQATTLVLYQDNGFVELEHSKYLAEHIQGSRFVAVDGTGVSLDEASRPVMDLIEEFLTGVAPAERTNRVLATVLYTDIVGSTQAAVAAGDRRWTGQLDTHDDVSRAWIERSGGRLIKTTGDGVLATFDAPGRALRCAHAIVAALREHDIDIRAGLHTGEVELRHDGDVGGVAAHIGARVMDKASTGEVWCSRTVRDLVAGSEFVFEERGTHTLKGIPEDWQLFAVKEK